MRVTNVTGIMFNLQSNAVSGLTSIARFV